MARPRLARSLVLVTLLSGAWACSVEAPAGEAPGRAGAEQGVANGPSAARPRPEFVAAGAGELDVVVRQALTAAAAEGRRVVVYVGASWCEPCQAFHQAVERGELDEALAGVRFLELDSDHDGARLEAAGYGGRLIPRFVVPGADGRGSAQRMEGGIKGDGAVRNIMERLGPLLGVARP
jgi:thiol-disulfide isomerase/thioredoxin